MLDLGTESKYLYLGYDFISGIDEAGRGPLAGPVVAAAVLIDRDFRIGDDDLKLVADSKKLTAKKREYLFGLIKDRAKAVEIGLADNKTIDKINILQASFLAMRRALNKLSTNPNYLLVDGNMTIPKTSIAQSAIVNGDAKVWTIAAASIIAKVSRDWLMSEYDKEYPQYGFAKHKGYGTKLHLENIAKYGPCPIHRLSFAPFKQKDKQKKSAH